MSTSDQITINAQKREVTGKKVAQLRRQGLLPGILYGHTVNPQAIQMNAHEVSLIINKITPTTLINVNVDGNVHKAMIRDRQRDVIYGHLLHLDFLTVSLTEKLRVEVELVFVGEAPVLKLGDALINQGLEKIEIECLPQDMPDRIEVDLSSLATIEDMIYVRDLQLGNRVAILADPDEVIASVGFVAMEESEKPAVEPEQVERKKDKNA